MENDLVTLETLTQILLLGLLAVLGWLVERIINFSRTMAHFETWADGHDIKDDDRHAQNLHTLNNIRQDLDCMWDELQGKTNKTKGDS